MMPALGWCWLLPGCLCKERIVQSRPRSLVERSQSRPVLLLLCPGTGIIPHRRWTPKRMWLTWTATAPHLLPPKNRPPSHPHHLPLAGPLPLPNILRTRDWPLPLHLQHPHKDPRPASLPPPPLLWGGVFPLTPQFSPSSSPSFLPFMHGWGLSKGDRIG